MSHRRAMLITLPETEILTLSDKYGDRSGTDLVRTPISGLEIPATDMTDVFGKSLKGYFVEYQEVGLFDFGRFVFGSTGISKC